MPAKKSGAKKTSAKKTATAKSVKSTKSAKTGAVKATGRLAVGKVKAIKAQDVTLNYLDSASKFCEARKKDTIHPRKILPKVARGAKVQDLNPTAAMALDAAAPRATRGRGVAPLAATDTLTLVRNVQLNDIATADTASHVCEPSVAINGDVVFYTGNWFAAVSTNGGVTFKYVNPYTTFPNPPGMVFCCDQVVHYISSIDTFVWLLQYGRDTSGKNIQRIAYAKTAQVKTGTWKYFDITPAGLGLGAGIWLDFPDLAVGRNNLYMSSNCFAGNIWKSSVIARIKLSSFTTGTLSATRAISTTHGSLRVAQNCGTTAYFAAHNSTSSLRVFSWKEADAAPTANNISVASWVSGSYSSTTPDGRDWLARADSRHTGATLAGNELWFAWGSGRGGASARPHPFVQIARINATTMTLIENITLWDPNSAIFYAALNTNANNEVGTSYTIGGGARFPTHIVGILTGTRRFVQTFTSTRGPADNKWGDYLTVRRSYPNERIFCASGYSLQSGAGASDATPNLTIFGRSTEV